MTDVSIGDRVRLLGELRAWHVARTKGHAVTIARGKGELTFSRGAFTRVGGLLCVDPVSRKLPNEATR